MKKLYVTILLTTFLIGCSDKQSYFQRFNVIKKECMRLAQKLGTEYDIFEDYSLKEDDQTFICRIIDSRTGHEYNIYGVEQVRGGFHMLRVKNHLDTNVAFDKCVKGRLPNIRKSIKYYKISKIDKAVSECAQSLGRER